jgi:hypothetical protein
MLGERIARKKSKKEFKRRDTEYAEKGEVRVCLTIGEGGNTLGACENSSSVCSKWIF